MRKVKLIIPVNAQQERTNKVEKQQIIYNFQDI